MHSKYDKTLSPLAAYLIVTLNDRNQHIFTFQEADKILEGHTSTANLLAKLVKNGIATRLKGGLFRLVPFELGSEHEYMGNPFVVARELALGTRKSNKQYFLSHASAFELHQLVTQPQLVIYTSSPKLIRSRIILGTEFRFVKCKEKDFFGITEMWVNKNEKIQTSDLERTLLDGLKQPAYCGGFSEVAKAFSIKKQMLDPQKMIDYAIRLNVGAVIRRLGYIMELYQIGSKVHLDFLQTQITSTYQLLDPELPADGPYLAKWRLNLNISQEELLAIRET